MSAANANVQGSTPTYRPRENRRSTSLTGWFVRCADHTTAEFTIVNLSYNGCRMRTSLVLEVGEQLRLSVRGLGMIDATVRWHGGADTGLFFDSGDSGKVKKSRKGQRYPTELEVLARRAGRRSQWIEATDVSATGCCLRFVDPPREGDLIWVQLPGLEALESEVRWVTDRTVGVHFGRPIHEAVFSLLVERWKVEACPRSASD